MARFILIIALLIGSFSGLLSGCVDESVVDTKPFVCTPETCPQGSCKLSLVFHDDCAQKVKSGEVLLNNALEPKNATYGTTYTSMGDIPVGKIGVFFVRASEIQWGPLDYPCETSGSGTTVILSCCPEGSDEPCNDAE
jgi:hypothetical protein